MAGELHPPRFDTELRTIGVQHIEQRTENTEQSERVKRKLAAHKAAIAVRTKQAHLTVKVPIPKLCLPPADDSVRHKIRAHVICVIIGAIAVGICNVILGDAFALHFGTFVQTGPNLGMYALDRVRNR